MTETSRGAQQRNCFSRRAALQQSVPHVFSRTALNNHAVAKRDRLLLFRVTTLSSVVSSLGQIWSQWWDNPSFCHSDTHKRVTKKLKKKKMFRWWCAFLFVYLFNFLIKHSEEFLLTLWRVDAPAATEHTGECVWQFKKNWRWVWPQLTAVPVRIRVPCVTSQSDLQTLAAIM